MQNIYNLEKQLKAQGAAFVGFSEVRENLDIDLKSLPYAITVGIRLSDFTIDQINEKPTFTYFHHYRTVNFLLDQITLQGVIAIQDMGYNAISVPSSQTVNDKADAYCGIFPHKTAAVKSGLGWIGKSGLFISNDCGPRVRLATILTDMELPTHKGTISASECKDCNLCVKACPADAITGEIWTVGCERSKCFDAKKCSDYMNKNFKHIGRGSVCGICIKNCPYGGRK